MQNLDCVRSAGGLEVSLEWVEQTRVAFNCWAPTANNRLLGNRPLDASSGILRIPRFRTIEVSL